MRTYSMPAPDTPDVWQRLARETAPLIIYGMGNGGDKMVAQFEKRGLTVADFMASDGFVRGQSFHGKTVLSLAQIQEKYPRFVLVVAFASSRPEVTDWLYTLADTYPLYMPDLPVAGETCFDGDWYRANRSALCEVAEKLADEDSRNLLRAILTYKLTGDIRILREAHTAPESEHARLRLTEVKTYVDCGAYNGDTLREVIGAGAPLTNAVCVEPDPATYRRLVKYTDTLTHPTVQTVCAAVWDTPSVGVFHGSGNRNSSLVGASYEHKSNPVSLVTVDALSEALTPDYIKYDVEGAEREALLGTAKTLLRARPRLLVSLYHRTEDLLDLPRLVLSL